MSNCWCEKCTQPKWRSVNFISHQTIEMSEFFEIFFFKHKWFHSPTAIMENKNNAWQCLCCVFFFFSAWLTHAFLILLLNHHRNPRVGIKLLGGEKNSHWTAEQQQHIPRPVYHNQTLIKPLCKQSLCLCASGITLNLILSVLIWVLLWANLFSMILSCSLGSLLQLRFRKPKPELQTPSACGTTAQFGSTC